VDIRPKGKPDCPECHGRGWSFDCSTDELDVCPPEVPCSRCHPELHAEARKVAIDWLLAHDYSQPDERETTGQLMFWAGMLFWPPPTKETLY
jgi:hypothetical protein